MVDTIELDKSNSFAIKKEDLLNMTLGEMALQENQVFQICRSYFGFRCNIMELQTIMVKLQKVNQDLPTKFNENSAVKENTAQCTYHYT